jgi:hypothetical protein
MTILFREQVRLGLKAKVTALIYMSGGKVFDLPQAEK